MQPLTDATPKPLLTVRGKALLQYPIEALVKAGVTDIVINAAWLGQQIVDFVGDGSQFGARIHVSLEDQPLESGGGLLQALPLLGDEPFIGVNGDVFCDYDYSQLLKIKLGNDLAHLVMVPNPSQHPSGDFGLSRGRIVADPAARHFTFSGIRVFSPQILAGCRPGLFSVIPYLKQAIAAGRVSGELYSGTWVDVGTPERLAALQ